jgi:hypothetical protein
MDLAIIHARLATTVVLFSGIAGIWSLIRYLRGGQVDGSIWGMLAVGELLFLAQPIVGIMLWLGGARPARGIHLLYGAIVAFSLPAYFASTRGRDDRPALFAYSLILFFVLAIALRAMSTA